MKPELQAQLYAKYPEIFKEHSLPMTQTAMNWGCQHGDGWFDILDHLCYALTYTYSTGFMDGEEYITVEAPQVVFTTVKEKYGTLRVYHHLAFDEAFCDQHKDNPELERVINRYSSYYDGIVHMAECMSERTCEETGKPGELHVTGNRYGWYKTLNREHAKTDPFCVSRGYVPVADLPKEPEEVKIKMENGSTITAAETPEDATRGFDV